MNRWKMNRIGFVNFWLYDEEDFEFCDGKLLLRGQNGSGKSITTQSFIPFVLDGDRTPSRLDPFGSSDRRMEYYFLGDGDDGKDESTGYLFLEFKMAETEEYRTIGIGQRAKRGKPMEFWGFVILDGRRVGYDLLLYRETGSAKIPYDKRELRGLIGESNLFTDSQSEYKKLVNQHIFGFRKEEQYEQFIKLLVKVRAPKLSKEFKPTKVYDILNDSLQTLSDEELHAMVDAMEKMDGIQESLEMLNRAFSDVKYIRTEYARYNQYLLAKKAQAYLRKKEEREKAQGEYDKQINEEQGLKAELKSMNEVIADLEAQEKSKSLEMRDLLDTDIEEIDRKLASIKADKNEVEKKKLNFETKIDELKRSIFLRERNIYNIENQIGAYRNNLDEYRRELDDIQENLQWKGHVEIRNNIKNEQLVDCDEISEALSAYSKLIEEARNAIKEYEIALREYDEVAEQIEIISKEKRDKEKALTDANQTMLQIQDEWIEQLFSVAKNATHWKLSESLKKEIEVRVRVYDSSTNAGIIQNSLRDEYEHQRSKLIDRKPSLEYKMRMCCDNLKQIEEELLHLNNLDEIEPIRNENAVYTRQMLESYNIKAVPFFKAFEFSDKVDQSIHAKLEAQLEAIGLLDALLVSSADYEKIKRECPEFLDTIVYAPSMGKSNFSMLVPSEELEPSLLESAKYVLSNIYEDGNSSTGVYLSEDGTFLNGLLAGRAKKNEAEFLGSLARKRKKDAQIAKLNLEKVQIEEEIAATECSVKELDEAIDTLEQEYKSVPGFNNLNECLEMQRTCKQNLESITAKYKLIEVHETECKHKKQDRYQHMLKKCKAFPYGRTEDEYTEIIKDIDSYKKKWVKCWEILFRLNSDKANLSSEQEYKEKEQQYLDDAFVEERECNTKIKAYDTLIEQYENYLNRPDIAEKAGRIQILREEIGKLQGQLQAMEQKNIRTDERIKNLQEGMPKQIAELKELIAQENILSLIFEEEIALKLVIEQGNRTLAECAKDAVSMLRDGDKNREYGEVLQSLNQAWQKHSSNLTKYGTALEPCFTEAGETTDVNTDFSPLRKRMRVVSVWNGKKVFLEEFYQIIKTAISETEELIQAKDRELFEEILSQTISQQLTDRIAESRNWVRDMSKLMNELDTSMGLSFSLDWKPRSAESDGEIDTQELETILLRDRELLTNEDMQKVASHFRSKIRIEKLKLEAVGGFINYMELVRDALDYRKWFEFRMFYKRGNESKKPLTNAAFNRFSGGEKAMAMYVPLFAAVNAQYKKADYEAHPRIIALDEAFAGVDDKNISSMFELVDKLDFDYIMNSQSLWGCYESVRGIGIAELHRPMNSQLVTVIRYTWNGHERILDVQ